MRRLRVVLLAGGLALLTPRPAHAWVGALLKAASSAAKVGKTAGTAAKGAKGAAAAGKVATAGKAAKLGTVGLAADALVNGGRGMRALSSLPDELGSAAGYVARQGDELVMLDRTGAHAVIREGDLLGAADDLKVAGAADDIQTVDLIIDPVVAADDPLLASAEHIRYHAVDGDGVLHTVSQADDGSWVVDVAGHAVDLADFGASAVDLMLADYEDEPELLVESASTAPSIGEDDRLMMVFYGVLVVGIGAFSWREYKKPSRRISTGD